MEPLIPKHKKHQPLSISPKTKWIGSMTKLIFTDTPKFEKALSFCYNETINKQQREVILT